MLRCSLYYLDMEETLMTRKQKQAIRAHWSYMRLVFKKDGSVWASKGGALGLLYTPAQAVAHLRAIGL
jgi:hypothetical protein